MADDERPAVGSVAQEAARLLDALGGWASTTQAGYAAAATGGRTAPTPGGHGHDNDHGHDHDRHQDPDSAAGQGHRCASCGAENGVGQAVTCQLCPVCQGIGLLRSVRPETVDRLADLAGALAATLRDIAGQRRTDDGPAATGSTSGASGKASGNRASGSRGRLQDIVVDDEDELHGTEGSATS